MKQLLCSEIVLIFNIVLLVSLAACCDDDPPCTDPLNPGCPNYDPCLAFQPANADFLIIDSIYGTNCHDGRGRIDLVSEVDTTYASNELYFRALYDADTYEWRVGSDPTVYHEKEFSLYFPLEVAPADIDVQLIACKDDPSNCQAKTCDTLIKNFHLMYTNGSDTFSLAIGKFRGIDLDAPHDTFTIEIPPPLPSLVGIINFPKGCSGQFLSVTVGRKGFILYETPTVCQSACGIGNIQADRNTLVIDYSIDSGENRILKKFIGNRIE